MLRTFFLLAVVIALAASSVNAQELRTRAECQGSSIAVTWTFFNDPGGFPEFVGYDLYRQALPECSTPIRLNDQPIPRQPGFTHSRAFTDASLLANTMYRYHVLFVDQNRQPWIGPIGPGFCDPCYFDAWASCPHLSAPLAHGTLRGTMLPLWLELVPCPGSCYGIPGIFPNTFLPWLINQPWPPELNQYVDTGIGVRIFGDYQCELTEGCAINMTAFDVAPCGVIPVEASTWGAIKATYE